MVNQQESKPLGPIELRGLQPPAEGNTGYLGFEIRTSWMDGHLIMRMPETLNSSQGLHFIDHERADMPPLSRPEPFPVWNRDEQSGEIRYEMTTDEGVTLVGRAWPEDQRTAGMEFRVINNTGKPMKDVHSQQCLVLTPSSDFGRPNTLETTRACIDGKWTDLSTTTPSAEDMGRDPWILMMMKDFAPFYTGSRDFADGWWVTDQVADEFIIARVSEDRRHLVAITWDEQPAQMLMSNARIPCLHAGPDKRDHLAPGQEYRRTGRIYLMENDPELLLAMYQADRRKMLVK